MTRPRRRVVTVLGAALLGISALAVPAGAQEPQREPASAATSAQKPEIKQQLGADKTRVVKRVRLPDGTEETTVRVGPITMMPHEHEEGAGRPEPLIGPKEPMHGTHTPALALLTPPCTDCFITGTNPNLVYENGDVANYNTGAVLHHAVYFDRSKADVTCEGGWVGLAGRRLFASGNERTGGDFQAGYGLRFGPVPMTYVLLELMNMKPQSQDVYFESTFRHVPAGTPNMEELTPIWTDAANCLASTHSVPKGESRTNWEWKSTLTGMFKRAGGHLHDGGVSIAMSNANTNDEICRSNAAYGSKPAFEGHIENMSTCKGDLGRIKAGETLRMDSHYEINYPDDGAMSIMVLYLDEDD